MTEHLMQAVPAALSVAMPMASLELERAGQRVHLVRLSQRLVFTRKPPTLDCVPVTSHQHGSYPHEEICAFGMVVLSAGDFDDFAQSLCTDREWLGRFWDEGYRQALAHRAHEVSGRLCLLVTAQGRPILAVDTQGASYARYVATIPGVVYRAPEMLEGMGPMPPELARWASTPEGTRQVLSRIALEQLRVPTLEARESDRLDFHEVSVWSLRDALLYAYTQGLCDGAAGAG